VQQKNILFAILNWGLGHASRSIPIIKHLQSEGYNVIICSDGSVIPFLKKELSDITYETLPGYNVHYRHPSMALNMFLQAPKLLRAYRAEKKVFRKLVEKHNPIIALSDNRYGCYSDDCPSFFIGHQWNILQTTEKAHSIASYLNKKFILRFKALLIPDDIVLDWTGKLTENLPEKRHHLLGILSRFERDGILAETDSIDSKNQSFLAILSGPEPARSRMEKTLIKYCASKPNDQFTIIRGTSKISKIEIPNNCESLDIADQKQIQELSQKANILICRSGYSSIMDYISLGIDRILFIPTPGQTEQEYLAERLSTFYSYDYLEEKSLTIESLDDKLQSILDTSDRISASSLQINNQSFKKVIDRILNTKL